MGDVASSTKDEPEKKRSQVARWQKHHREGTAEEVDEHVEWSEEAPDWPRRSDQRKEDGSASNGHDGDHIRHISLQVDVFLQDAWADYGDVSEHSNVEPKCYEYDGKKELIHLRVLPELLEEVRLVNDQTRE